MSWTEERIDTLKTLWAAGLSCSQIANKLELTSKNAVIGKVHRLGLEKRVKTPQERPSGSALKRRPRASKRPLGYGPPTRPSPFQARAVEQPSLQVPLLELHSGQCRFPTHENGQHLFCGQAAERAEVYCAAHCRIAYNYGARR